MEYRPEEVRDRLVEKIRCHMEACGMKNVVLGISGGKDSTVVAALCVRALGAEHVYGVMLPDGEQKDIEDSKRVFEALGIKPYTVNIGKIHEALRTAASNGLSEELEKAGPEKVRCSDINVGPRLRMTVLRYVGQAVDALLCGTGNLSEATVGYCTKGGDACYDFNPIGKLTTVEVVQVGLTMPELPVDLVNKTPSDGLSGMSDEDKLGVTYGKIHDYIRKGTSGDPEADALIRKLEKSSAHKRCMPPVLDPFTDMGSKSRKAR